MPRQKGTKDSKPRAPRWDKGMTAEQKAEYKANKGKKQPTPQPTPQPEPEPEPEPIFTPEPKPEPEPEPIFTPEPEPEPKPEPRQVFAPPADDFSFQQVLKGYEDATEPENVDIPEPFEPENINEPQAERPIIRLSGAMFLALIDSILPRGVVAVGRMFDKRAENFSYRDIQMTDSEKKDHEEMAAQIAATYLSGINPIFFFVASIGLIYGSNFEKLLSEQPKPEKKEIPEIRVSKGEQIKPAKND